MARRQTVIFNSMLAVGAVILGLLLNRADPDGFHWWAIPAIIGLLLLFVFLIRFSQHKGVSKQLKGVPAANEPYVFTFADEGISIAGRLSDANIKWEAILRAHESKTDFLFYTTKRFAQFLPKRAFANDDTASELRAMLNQKIPGKAELLH